MQEADPDWIEEAENLDIRDDTIDGTIEASTAINRNDSTNDFLREVEFMRIERQVMERELQVAAREIEVLRLEVNVNSSRTQPNIDVKAVCELLNDLNGSEGSFKNWERQVNLLNSTYQLSEVVWKILIGFWIEKRVPVLNVASKVM